MKAAVAAFNQEKALVGAFSVMYNFADQSYMFGYVSAPADVECDQLLPAEPQRGGHHDGQPQHLRLLHLHAGQVAGKIFGDGVKIFVFRVWHFGSVYCIINQFISLTTVGVTCGSNVHTQTPSGVYTKIYNT